MTIKEKFLLIGFTGFVHLDKKMRDGKERITFCSKYCNEWIFLLLVNEDDIWKIEKNEDNDIISTTIDTEDLLLFFKNYYYANNDFSNDL
ncbi:hypothetical protein AAYQ05_11935 [Flavobacterium sp. B11]|uniref:hypothetical protein n=1 Tax=Flavobacterium movens TaxID=214860 RepID=UPI0031CE1451